MRRKIIVALAAMLAVVASGALAIHAQDLPERFMPKIEKVQVTRKVDNIHSTYWTYTLLITGHNFSRKSKVEVDGAETGKVHYQMAGRDVIALRCVLKSFSRVYQKRKKYKVNVVNGDESRSNVVEVSW